jgi:hypothetical protein
MTTTDYELLLRVRTDMLQAINGLDGVRKQLDSVGAETERTSRRASAAVDGMGQKFEGLKKLVAGLALAAGIKAVFDAVTESEDALAQLDARMKSTGNAAGLSRQQYIDLASAMQQVTKFGDEAVLGVENMLLTFKGIKGPVFQQATEAVLDLATVMGTDLTSAAVQLGKALNDPVLGLTGLAKAGIQFSDEQKAVIKSLVDTGQLAAAQKIILQELAGQMGGSARAAANTFAGALAQLKNAAGDLLEGDGGNLPETAASIRELTQTLQDPSVKDGFAAMVNGLVSVASYAAKAAGAFAGFGSAVADFFRDNENKSYMGLLQQRMRLEDKKSALENNPIAGRLGWNKDDIAELDRQIAQINKLILLRNEAAKPKPAIKSGEAPGAIDTLPTVTVSASKQEAADKAAADKAAAQAAKFIAAGDALRQTLIDLQGALDPTTKAWADYNKAVADANAKAVLARQAPGANVASIDAQRDAIIQLAATQRDAAIDKISDADKKAYQDLLAAIDTPAQAQLAQPLKQLADLNAMLASGKITAEEFAAAQAKLGDSITTTALPTYGGNDALIGGAAGELLRARQAQQHLEDVYAKQQEFLVQSREKKLLTLKEYNDKEEALEKEHAERLAELDQAKQQAAMSAAVTGFGQLADAAKSAYGEQSKQYHIAFALQKAAALAQSILAIQTSIAESSKIGYPWNIAAIAGAVAQGVSVLATINSTNLNGYSGGGYTGPGGKDEPAGVVHAGEVVWSQRDIARAGGVGVVEAMRLGYRGYADGGFVGTPNPVMPPADIASTSAGGANGGNKMRVYVLQNEDQLAQRLAQHPAMEKAVIAIAGENGTAIRAEW